MIIQNMLSPLEKKKSIRNTNNAISKIKSFDLSSANEYNLRKVVGKLFQSLEIKQMLISTGQVFYRVVRVAERPTNVGRIKNPDPEIVKNYGRANKPGQSVFYACAHPYSPFQEIQLQVGECFAMSTWTSMKEIRSFEIGSSRKSTFGGQIATEPTTEASRIAFDFLSNEFLRQVQNGAEFEYKLSAMVAEMVMGNGSAKGSPFVGVTYPSTASSHLRENVALRANIVDSHLKLDKVIYGRVESINNDHSTYHVAISDKSESLDADGTINWTMTAGVTEKLIVEPKNNPRDF